LDQFTSAITGISAHGEAAAGNARKLQPSKGYPVVLREAEDVSTALIFQAPGQEQFEATVANTRAEQAKVQDAVEQSVNPKTASELGKMYSAEYIASHQGALALQDHSYQTCLREMDRISKELVAAKGRAATQCGGEASARNELEESGAGVTHIEAANRLNGQRQLCSDEEQVVATLEQQTQEQAHRCEALKDRAAEQVAQAALGDAAHGTAAANNENEDANVESNPVFHAASALTGSLTEGVEGVAAASDETEADRDHEDAHESGNSEAEETMEETGQGVEDTIRDVTDVSGCDSIMGC
jgi:hypothetical protein